MRGRTAVVLLVQNRDSNLAWTRKPSENKSISKDGIFKQDSRDTAMRTCKAVGNVADMIQLE